MVDGLSDRIQSIVADQLGVDPVEVTKDASILDDLGADSLDLVELVMHKTAHHFRKYKTAEIRDIIRDSIKEFDQTLRSIAGTTRSA